ncbi:Cna B-type domain-containing protein, partial [Methanobrevibacter sp.]|uniref:Cna B-type domain-containing protein n=1 Tax=Methanobrevibacter sp. TaxID=66852 RepID=UPI00386400B1
YKSEVTNSTLYNWTIINTHVPDVTVVNVTKVWNDNDNKDGFRPANVTVILLANGTEINRTVLSNATGWNFTFSDLPLRKNGTDINYTVKEEPVDNYSINITDLGNGKFVINNTQIVKVCDLEIKKLVNASNVYVNDLVEWRIVIKNNGPSAAENVIVKDTLPDGLVVISSSKDYERDGYDLIWNIGELQSNETIYIVLVTQVQKEGQIDNFVTVNTTTNESDYDNNKANNTTYVNPICDLAISKVVNASNIYVNECVSWNITVINYGPSTAMDVVVKDTLPEGIEILSANPSAGTFDKETRIWKIGNLDQNTPVYLILVTKILTEGSITNIAVVNTTTNETNTSNNEANNTTVADPICDLIINKTVNASSIDVGDNVEWTINVINVGPSTALDVKVKDALPEGVLILSASPSAGSFDEETRIWKIGELKANEPVSLVLVTQILIEGNITNVVSVNTTTYEPNKTNNEANNTTLANPICDLAISKFVNSSVVYLNEFVEWTIVVVNNGPSVAKDVVVTDIIPNGLVLVNSTTYVGSYEKGIWTIGDLEKDTPVSLVLITQALEEGNITNIAVANTTTPDKNTTNNIANNTTEVKPVCDLEIIKLVNASSVNITDLVEWTIVVVNNGPGVAYDVVVSDNLPSGLKLLNADPSVGNYNDGIWSIGNLEKDSSVSLVLITQAIEEGNITNVVTVNSTTPDSNRTNNKANNTTNVKPVCDLEIVKLVSAEKAYVGEELTWTIRVINHGPSAAKNVKVFENIPGSLKFIKAIGTKGKYDAKTQVWTIGTLESGSTATLKIVTEVLSVGNITNPVEVTTSTHDSNKTNNKANNTTKGIAAVDLAVVKYADKATYHEGDVAHWYITVINYGPCVAHNVVAFDVLPSACKFIDYKATKGTYDVSTGKWTIGDLAKGESVTLEIICNVTKAGNITNEVYVTCDENDTNPDNNYDNATVEVLPNEPPVDNHTPVLHETGNPIAYLVIALFAIFASVRSRNRKE